jgi:hypothetical protein
MAKIWLTSTTALLWLTSVSATEIVTVDFEEFSDYPNAPIVSKEYIFDGNGSSSFESGYVNIGGAYIDGLPDDRVFTAYGYQDSCWTYGAWTEIIIERADGGPFALHNLDTDASWVRGLYGISSAVTYRPFYDDGPAPGSELWLDLKRVELFTDRPPGFCDPSFEYEMYVDDLELQEILNAEIDFEAWNSANNIRPKDAYLFTIGVKTTSIADGDARDFDASSIDPATVTAGPALARNVIASPPIWDFDGDGDLDAIFGFRMEDTGITCLDTDIKLVASTVSGGVIAGRDSVNRVNCEAIVDIDFSPYYATNDTRPNDAYFETIGIKTMNTANGDAINFDATQVDVASVLIGPGQAPNIAVPLPLDFDSDGDIDLVVGFRVEDSGIACADTEIIITGETHSGVLFTGTDDITTTDCETGGCHP